jgi:tetratricopeptide (TPR) repeat protein
MRTLVRMTMLMALLLVAAPASAQRIATVGKEIPDVKLKVKDKDGEREFYLFRRLRGGITVFYFWRPRNLDSVERIAEMEELHRKYADKGVRFVSATAAKEDKAKEVMEKKSFEFFRYNFLDSLGPYYHLGAFSEPYVVLIDPRSILVWRGVPDNRLEERLADLIEQSKPPIGDPKWLDRHYRQAERLHDQHEYGKAYTIARALYKMTDESHAMHEKAKALMEKCEAAAEEWLKEGNQAWRDGDLKKAARIVAEIAVRFEDPDEDEDDRSKTGGRRDDKAESVKRKAEMMIGQMNADRELKKLIREAVENAKGELLNDQAAGLEDDDYYIEAQPIYEKVVKEYKETEAAKEAKRRLKRIERDQTIRTKIAESRASQQAGRWLDLGDRFAAMELYDEAREHYERLIKEHPDTLAATRAKERLSKLPKPEDTAKAGSGNETTRADSNP